MSAQRENRTPLCLYWQQIEEATKKLGRMLPPNGITAIVPVIRGGLPPATIMSYYTKIPILTCINPNHIEYNEARVLIVDDVCDSGATFARIGPHWPHAYFAALYGKPDGVRRVPCDFIAEHVPQDCWLEFPWGE